MQFIYESNNAGVNAYYGVPLFVCGGGLIQHNTFRKPRELTDRLNRYRNEY